MSKSNIDLGLVEAAAVEEWQRSPHIRSEFDNDLQSFVAFKKADAQGLVKILFAPERK